VRPPAAEHAAEQGLEVAVHLLEHRREPRLPLPVQLAEAAAQCCDGGGQLVALAGDGVHCRLDRGGLDGGAQVHRT